MCQSPRILLSARRLSQRFLAPLPLTALANAVGCIAYNRLIRRRLTNFQALTGCGLEEVLELGPHQPAILFFRAIDQYIRQQKAT